LRGQRPLSGRLFDCRRGGGAGLLLARDDLVVRLFLGGGHRIFGVLRANREVGQLFREFFSHVLAPLEKYEVGSSVTATSRHLGGIE
jgi:hypothetical protein